MNQQNLKPLRIGTKTAKLPIVQGGMGVGISGASLATAVANSGGIGVISAVGIGVDEPDFKINFKSANSRALRREIQKCRANSDGLIGVNIMVALTDFDDLMEAAVDEGVDFLFLGAGLPLKFSDAFPAERLKTMSTKIIPIVSSAKAMKVIFNFWQKKFDHIPDGVVVEGPMAGGHLGFKKEQIEDPQYALEAILPQVVEAVKIYENVYDKSVPIIAAGGIFSGGDIHRMLQLGAQGVQMGTRFVATYECDADAKFKEAYVNATQDDITIIQSPVGLPGRAIQNQFLIDVANGIKQPFSCPWKCLRTCDYKTSPYCIALALTQAKKGRLQNGFAFAGSNVWRVNEIISVQELMDTLVDEYEKAHLETVVV